MIEQAPETRHAAPVTIRDAGQDDIDAVMDIMGSAFPPTYGEAWTRSQCTGILPMAGVALRLATDPDGKVVGFALLRVVVDESELLLIAVDPAAQGKGVGAALVDDFVAYSRSHGAHGLHLEVRDGNAAMSLYKRAGFAIAGRRRDYYRGADGHKRDALTLAFKQ